MCAVTLQLCKALLLQELSTLHNEQANAPYEVDEDYLQGVRVALVEIELELVGK